MKTQTTTYYLAYGMNTNKLQMARRCPAAIPVGTMTLNDYQFVFRGVGDILPTNNPKKYANCVVWKITPECEKALDRLEGYPNFYTKIYIDIELNGEVVKAMAYKMKNESYNLSDPSPFYWDMLFEGYKTYGLPIDQLFLGLPKKTNFRKSWEEAYIDVTNIKTKRRLKNIKSATYIY